MGFGKMPMKVLVDEQEPVQSSHWAIYSIAGAIAFGNLISLRVFLSLCTKLVDLAVDYL